MVSAVAVESDSDELHEWLSDNGWIIDETRNDGVTLWRWPVNDYIIEVPYCRRLRVDISLVFLAADIMASATERNPFFDRQAHAQ